MPDESDFRDPINWSRVRRRAAVAGLLGGALVAAGFYLGLSHAFGLADGIRRHDATLLVVPSDPFVQRGDSSRAQAIQRAVSAAVMVQAMTRVPARIGVRPEDSALLSGVVNPSVPYITNDSFGPALRRSWSEEITGWWTRTRNFTSDTYYRIFFKTQDLIRKIRHPEN